MADNLATYLHDHLAGAQFATALLSDLSQHMGLSKDEMEGHLKPLLKKGKVRIRPHQDSVYYEAAEFKGNLS